MERKMYNKLVAWKNNPSRKPLILQGAHHVGKTYLVNYFAQKEYINCVYCNFERDQNLYDFFDNLSPKDIIKKISLYKRKEIFPMQTLIIFDEIQAFPRAITSLKYFCEDANEYHIIGLGSLLGIAVNRENFSFPVGKVQFMRLYPLDFEEYLMAKNEQELINMITNCYLNNLKLDDAFHQKALEYYKEYLFVGGMPEAVEEFNKNKNTDLVRLVQQTILDSYFSDMSKYNKSTEIAKTSLVYKTISKILAKENKKFQYKDIKKGGRSLEFEKAIEWIALAGIATQLYRLEQVMLPLDAYKSLSDFKFYMNDVGLCSANEDLNYEDILRDDIAYVNFKGGLTENYVFNQLVINDLKLYYWTNKNQAEVDFITRIDNDIIPIEVKSSINNKAKSLNSYIQRYKPKYAIRISTRNFGFENNIKSVPLYATFCITKNTNIR